MLKRFPTDRQYDLMDCGPACLKIIAKYYGKYYSMQYLRDKCGTTREGISFLDLSYAAETIGIRTLPIEASIYDLKNVVPLPCIIHWNQSHFVVVYKVTSKFVFISDPARGLVNYTIQELRDKWYNPGKEIGSLMVLEPQADFKQRETGEKIERKKTLENFLGYFTSHKKSFFNLFVVMLLVCILQAFLPFISKAVIDVGIRTHDLNFINLVLIANVTILITITLSNAIRDWILLNVTSRVNLALISDYLIKLMRLPIIFFENKAVGDILQRANDHERIKSFIMNNSLSLIFSSITFLIFSTVLLIYNKVMFLIFLIGSLFYILWVLLFLKLRRKLDWEYFDLVSQNQSFWVEMVSAIQDIKLNNYERQKRWKWEKIQARMFKVNQKVMVISNWQSSGAQFINSLKNLLITFYCAKAVISGEITFGIMISTQFIIGMLNAPLSDFISFIISAQSAQISFLRLNEVHKIPDEQEEDQSNNIVLPEDKSLLIKNLVFHYNTNAPAILKKINLSIPSGKVTAIVGDSGSGKTTLLKLLLRMYEPTFGDIFIGNMNIKNINLKQWRDKCGVVLQDGKIFNDTIMNNIILDDENINYDRLRLAVSAANIGTEIEQLPKSYNTVMGEMGRGLSGGQKQRILIARALYKNPEYLFLDEATNSLDTINELKIIKALDELFKERTVVVIAHRLSTIKKADQIIVFKDGFIVEVGNHSSLMQNNGQYSNLIKSQYEGNQLENLTHKSNFEKFADLI
ncbi:ATP-binding cassette subfamily B protein [Pedobacter sp. AK017]|uniref:peptidase domain-containing ABC transporter n=1 Tax=Pedobacter sp. AK017 TaxID=2723073 RepID=UPI001611F743|nr:peptidase domain-containing ABC transporter [Pedobacter sp. AK017]MBB5439266.1 ATP-binding cassette subfamily B protein [Pedobacter sp. AK017]